MKQCYICVRLINQPKLNIMKIYNAVQTEERAKAIINEYVSDNNLTGGNFKNTSCQCECGETQFITWYNGDVDLRVAVCDACGDDNAFISDVLNIF